MIRQKFILRKYGGWEVDCYYAKTCYYTDEIMWRLHEIGIGSKDAEKAYANLKNSALDTGLTYSNPEERRAVVVIALSSSAGEFVNSFVHEIGHLATHIARDLYIDQEGEEKQYLAGTIAQIMWQKCSPLACKHCRERDED